jgi:hypothetical protein
MQNETFREFIATCAFFGPMIAMVVGGLLYGS